ncbi:MAG: hypothetical protein ACRDCE_11310 [Cetobacterium sp.]|uniref:tail fiber/spike domain-containing protein n=1 Tax=Cetobacterium sp. TaxID=2071632 RepID=UPI003EE44335
MMRPGNNCCGNEAGLVQKFIGSAYDVVKNVHDNLEEIKFIFDFMAKYDVLLCVESLEELKAVNEKSSKFVRWYVEGNGANTYTDYIYVSDDKSGVLPDNPSATGSWVKVNTFLGAGASNAIPWLYNKGSANGGEVNIHVEEDAIGVSEIFINGLRKHLGIGYTYEPVSRTIQLPTPLVKGDQLVAKLIGYPALPNTPNISEFMFVNWVYNNGTSIGGETKLKPPYTFQKVPAVFINGLRKLENHDYVVGYSDYSINLTLPLKTNDVVIVQLGGEADAFSIDAYTAREALRRTYAEAGLVLVDGSFEDGAKVTTKQDVVLERKTGKGYNWQGAILSGGKVIPAGSTPTTAGGIGSGKWVDVSAVTLREPITAQVRESLRRSYAEAGFNLVAGSFELGGTLVNPSDVLLQSTTGKAFTGPAGTVPAGTNPVSGGFVDVSGVLLKKPVDYIMMSYPLDATSYLPDGYVTDGSVSYTSQLQQALDDASGLRAVLLPNFPILVDPVGTTYGGLQVPSNSKVIWRSGSALKCKPNNLDNYEIIGIRDKTNIELFNPVIYGDKYTHTGSTGEFGMGISVRGACEDIFIYNPKIHDCWGDGIYIGQTTNTVFSTPKNIHIINPITRKCRRQGISVTSADGLFISNPGLWDTKSSDCATPLPNGPHAGIDIEPNGSFSMLRNIRITGLHGGGNDAGLFYVFLGAISNPYTDPYHVDVAVDGVSDDGSMVAIQLVGLNKDASYSGSIKIRDVSSDNAKLNGIRVRNWPIQCGLQATIDGVSISDWLSSASEPARSRAAIASYATEDGFPTIGNLAIKGITLRQSRPSDEVSERAFHGENSSGGVSHISLEFVYVKSTVELKSIVDGLVHITTMGDYASGLKRTISASISINSGEFCDYIVAPSGANPTITLPTFTPVLIGKVSRFAYVGGGTSTGFRLRTTSVPIFVNGVRGTNFIFYKTSGVITVKYADGAFIVRCDGEHVKES